MNAFQKLSKQGLALVFVASVAVPSVAYAEDAQGPRGSLSELEINHTTTDKYLQYHGRAIVVSHKQSNEYRWGGTSCGSRTLNDHLVTMLQRALESGTRIVPRYQPGQGQTLCLVGFTLSP